MDKKILKKNIKKKIVKKNIVKKDIVKKDIVKKEYKNIVQNLSSEDYRLLDNLNVFINNYCNDDHPLATGFLHKDGTIVYGLSSKNPMGYDVHGEHSAVSQAHIYDQNPENYVTIVSMTKSKSKKIKYKFKGPCGICRELLRHLYPNSYIISQEHIKGIPKKILCKYLLPFPYTSSKLKRKSLLNKDVNIKYIYHS
jgi:cytidine deaminase